MQLNIETIGERLSAFRKKIGISQTEMSTRANLNRSYVTHIETGKSTPSFDFLSKLMQTYDLSLDWLLSGNGHMFAKDREDIFSNVSDEELQILSVLNKLNEGRKSTVMTIIRNVLEL